MRLHDWQARLATLVDERRNIAFAWGVNDCCLWAADAVLAMTGKDFAAPFRGEYGTDREAAELVHRLGGVGAIASQALGAPVPAAMAAVGDVVLVVQDGRKALAICNGTTALTTGPHGLIPIGMDAALAAWKV